MTEIRDTTKDLSKSIEEQLEKELKGEAVASQPKSQAMQARKQLMENAKINLSKIAGEIVAIDTRRVEIAEQIAKLQEQEYVAKKERAEYARLSVSLKEHLDVIER